MKKRYGTSKPIDNFVKKIGILLVLLTFIGALVWHFQPVMGEKESYNALFAKEKFLAKIATPIPDWMMCQIESDFKGTLPITVEKVENVFAAIFDKMPLPIYCYHYRILDNELYKYIPPNSKSSCRDTYFEKAFKTLLSHCQVPDLDFILIPMDGIPESFMPPDFYLMEDPEAQVPILGQAKLKEPFTRSIVLIPDQLSLSDSWYNSSYEILALNDTIPWSKKIGKALWRGGVTDGDATMRSTPRLNLCRLSKLHPESIDALFYVCDCPVTKKLIEEEGLLINAFLSKEEHLHYKYLPALDGRMCTYPGFQWRLLSDSLTLKQESNQIQWFYGALQPFCHYLPIAADMSDLVEKIKWAEEHEQECLEMIQSARKFMSESLSFEDCYRYLYLVFQRYAKLQQIDFTSLKQKTKKDPAWINIQYRKRPAIAKLLHRLRKKNILA